LVAAQRITPSKCGKRDHGRRIGDYLWQINDNDVSEGLQHGVKSWKIKASLDGSTCLPALETSIFGVLLPQCNNDDD
jgi:hypothetical protein